MNRQRVGDGESLQDFKYVEAHLGELVGKLMVSMTRRMPALKVKGIHILLYE